MSEPCLLQAMVMSLQTSRVPQALPPAIRTMHCLKHANKNRYSKAPHYAPHISRKLINPRNKSSFAIRRTARLAMLNKKASCCLRSSRASSLTKSYTSLSTRRHTLDMPIRGTVWFSGRGRQNAFGGLWARCRSGYLNTLPVSSLLHYCLM